MNKVVAFLLAVTVLFQSSNFDINDLQKIPILVNHLSCHFEEGDSLSEFVSMHYGSTTNSHEKDHKEHKELPFKHEHVDSHFQLAFVIHVNQFPLEVVENTHDIKNFIYKEPLTSLVVQNFFQPPKIA